MNNLPDRIPVSNKAASMAALQEAKLEISAFQQGLKILRFDMIKRPETTAGEILLENLTELADDARASIDHFIKRLEDPSYGNLDRQDWDRHGGDSGAELDPNSDQLSGRRQISTLAEMARRNGRAKNLEVF